MDESNVKNNFENISREELLEKISRRERFFLVETLPAESYHHAHLPGAINIPASQIADLAASHLPDKNSEIVVYCANLQCDASEAAARELIEMGYKNVRDYAAGKQDWIDAGLEIESDHIHKKRKAQQ